MSTQAQAIPATPAKQTYTMNEAPSPDNAASCYPAEESCENMTPEQIDAKKRQYARGLLRFHKFMAGPDVEKARRGSADSASSAGSTGGI